MQRVQDVANIYGGIAGAMPGSPTQQFQPMPLATGIGGGLSAAYMLGMGGQNVGAGALQPNVTGAYSRSMRGGELAQHNILP